MSRPGSSLAEWLSKLETYSPYEIKLGLERVSSVLQTLQLPRPKRVFTVGGTNGKGSSVAMLEAILLQSGASVGSYTSPHIVAFNERICSGGAPASDADIIAAFERVDAARGDTELTYFEFGTLAALVVFAERQIDNVILEVGLGGRLDAVNAVDPDVALITNVSLDHCDWLGTDVESIAFEKAGIMRHGKPAIFAADPVPQTLSDHAAKIGADLWRAGQDFSYTVHPDGRFDWRGRDCTLQGLARPALQGDIQYANAAAVLSMLEAAGLQTLLDAEIVSAALSRLRLAGRMQVIKTDRHWILDVAHNPAAANVLAETLAASDVDGETIAIIAMLDDKDVESVVALLDSVVDRWIAVSAASPRAIDALELARLIANSSNTGCMVAMSLAEAMQFARTNSTPQDRIIVTGSFYVVGPAMQLLT
ncbi:MAG: bifunctional tetrahydrofolate synthase/dihydrofolate synthase [Woeseiaceae bacterium]